MRYRWLSLLLLSIVILFACQSGAEEKEQEEKIPGLQTMREHGTKLTPGGVLDRMGDAMGRLPGGAISYNIFQAVLNSPNEEPVFVIDDIEYNEQGLAVRIEGHVEVPPTYRAYVEMGGLGMPVYEAIEPNEFGVIFGRPGDIAVREGVVVKTNPLDEVEIYELFLKSESYDKVTRASILFQGYQAIRAPFLRIMLLELEGMLLNSSSKEVILEDIREFKEENRELNDEELMMAFLEANEGYIEMLNESDAAAKNRIKQARELLNAVSGACALQTVEIVKHFTIMATEIANIALSMNPITIAVATADYVARNVPKNMELTMADLKNIKKYGEYQNKKYNDNVKANRELWQRTMEITKKIR